MFAFISVSITILILLLAVTIHEFGHFIAGKLFKTKILEFAIGFGPSVYKRRGKFKTIYSFRIFPLGGYVKFGMKKLFNLQKEIIADYEVKGQIEKAEKEASKEWYIEFDNIKGVEFESLKPWQRIVIYLAGPLFNIVTTLVLMIIIEQLMYAKIGLFANLEKSPLFHRAENAGMQILWSIVDTFRAGVYILEAIGNAIKDMVTGNRPEVHSIVGLSKDAAKNVNGSNLLIWVLTLSMSLSASLGTFNLIPIPPLDGWRVLSEIIIKVRGKPINQKVEDNLTLAGVGVLLLFTLTIFIYDLV